MVFQFLKLSNTIFSMCNTNGLFPLIYQSQLWNFPVNVVLPYNHKINEFLLKLFTYAVHVLEHVANTLKIQNFCDTKELAISTLALFLLITLIMSWCDTYEFL